MQPCDEFQMTIFGAHHKMPWANRIFHAARFVTEHPEFRFEIGLIPIGTSSFIVNSNLFAQFIGVKRNSLNRDFQQHGFVRDVCSQETTPEPFSRNWTKRTFKYGPFNAQCTEEEICLASTYARQKRMGVEPVEANCVPPCDNGSSLMESFGDGADFYTAFFEDFDL
jgi:hypothetical protein